MDPPLAKDYIINDYEVNDSGNGNIGYPLDYYTDYNELVTSPSIRTMNDPYQAANSKMDSNLRRPDISSLMKLKDLRDLYQVPKSVPKKNFQRKPKPKYHYYY